MGPKTKKLKQVWLHVSSLIFTTRVHHFALLISKIWTLQGRRSWFPKGGTLARRQMGVHGTTHFGCPREVWIECSQRQAGKKRRRQGCYHTMRAAEVCGNQRSMWGPPGSPCPIVKCEQKHPATQPERVSYSRAQTLRKEGWVTLLGNLLRLCCCVLTPSVALVQKPCFPHRLFPASDH